MLKSRTFWALVLLACFFMACKSDPPYDRDAQAAIDDDSIRTFLGASSSDFRRTSDGLYYQILNEPDTGVTVANLTDTVLLHYVGRYLDGRLYDSTATQIDSIATRFVFNTAIEGWMKGIPFIKTGGRIRLIVPSTMAYQNIEAPRAPKDTLAANSIFDFNIRLIRVIPLKKQTTIN